MSDEIDRLKKAIEKKNTEINNLRGSFINMEDNYNSALEAGAELNAVIGNLEEVIKDLESRLGQPIDVVSESAHLWKSIAINSTQLGILDVHGVANIVCDAFEKRFKSDNKVV